MLLETLINFFKRDLNKLKVEIELYKNESNLWILEEGIGNSGGNLGLHIVGNLNHFIGAIIGNTGYIRKRDLEFSLKNIKREELLRMIDDTITMVETCLSNLPEEKLNKDYPKVIFESPMTTEYFLIHLNTHLSYHLGQVNYHRRLLDK